MALRVRRLTLAVVMTATMSVFAQAPDLANVLDRAERYVVEYEQRFSLLVAEEHYAQEAQPRRLGRIVRRVLRSDYLLVQLESGGGWMPFRDVFEVDGRPVRDREDRLVRLFLESEGDARLDQARRIMEESTRYNVGAIKRTINIPTLALLFLHHEVRPRFAFRQRGVETIDDREAWMVDFRETHRPTLVKTGNGRDLALTGRLWIDPATGAGLKTRMMASEPGLRAEITVTFRQDGELGLRVPDRMEERYRVRAPGEIDVSGVATYSNYRRFRVDTGVDLRKPPGS